jgi:SPP1 family predicted phage head-tail adaptor
MSLTPSADIGELRTSVAYEEKTIAGKDKLGQRVESWVALWSGMASVRPLSSREKYYGGEQFAAVTHRIAIRYRPGVKHAGRFRLVSSGRLLEVASVADQDERRQWLVIMAIELAS